MAKEVNKKEAKKKEKKHFWKDFKAELKKVIWPTPKQLVNNTVAVVTIVLITAAIVFVLDLAFESLNTYGINGLRSAVESSVDETQENTDTETDAESSDEQASGAEIVEDSSSNENTVENQNIVE